MINQQPNKYCTAVCLLFLRLPYSKDYDAKPYIDKDPCIRDSHWYIEQLLEIWHDNYKRKKEGSFFKPLPWYRRKEICSKVLDKTKVFIQRALERDSELYTTEDMKRLLDIIEENLGPIADKVYEEYKEKLERAYETIEKLKN